MIMVKTNKTQKNLKKTERKRITGNCACITECSLHNFNKKKIFQSRFFSV